MLILFVVWSINVNPNANKNKNNQESSIGRSKCGADNKVTFLLYNLYVQWFFVCCLATLTMPLLIESIYSKNNNYLLMDRAYELVRGHEFCTVVPSIEIKCDIEGGLINFLHKHGVVKKMLGC